MARTAQPREVERRVPVVNRETPARDLAALPLGLDIAPTGSFVQRALEHVRSIQGAEGLPAEFQADPQAQKTSSGAVAVHLQQQFKGLPIFLGAQTVRFKPSGELEGAIGSAFTVDADVPLDAKFTSAAATVQAAKHVAELGEGLLGEVDDFGHALDAPRLDVSRFAPQVIAIFPEMPEQPTVLEGGPFGHPIRASRLWYPAATELRLSWQVIITMPQGSGQYRVIVDARTGDILYSRQLVQQITGRGNVYRIDGTTRQLTDFPRPWADYGLPVPTWDRDFPARPDDWSDDPTSVGNSVNAHLGDSGTVLQGTLQGNLAIFDPPDKDGDDQKILNIFYYNCFLHDFFYLLGFREPDGNFQHDVRGRGGMPGERVDARAHSQAVWGTANMYTPPAGTSPTMNMGLVLGTGRHTAFDSTVVFHEYMHGVTNRLVGGPMNDHALEEPQSKAMGEGWGDYIACTINNLVTVGNWVTNKSEGIRSAPYDTNYPGRFGDIGTGIYVEMHRVGEIWCATLLEMNRNLDMRLGAPRGRNLALQLVVDALKLSPSNPNMLNMRDAILRALDNKHASTALDRLTDEIYTSAKEEIWKAFAKFGMGVRAASNGAQYSGVVADFSLPTGGVVTPSTPPPAVPSPTTPASPTPSTPDGTPSAPSGTSTLPPVGRVVRRDDPAATAIPDNSATGVNRVLTIPQAGTLKRLTVHVDIQHSYPGDLQLTLTPPGQPPILLYNRLYSAESSLIRDFRSEDTPALATLAGQPSQGDWTLKVSDLSEGETGTLRSWGLEVELAGASASAWDTASPLAIVDAGTANSLQEVMRVVGQIRQLGADLDRLLARFGPGGG
jgi:extracellular elastinolytic metalloproteinase